MHSFAYQYMLEFLFCPGMFFFFFFKSLFVSTFPASFPCFIPPLKLFHNQDYCGRSTKSACTTDKTQSATSNIVFTM